MRVYDFGSGRTDPGSFPTEALAEAAREAAGQRVAECEVVRRRLHNTILVSVPQQPCPLHCLLTITIVGPFSCVDMHILKPCCCALLHHR